NYKTCLYRENTANTGHAAIFTYDLRYLSVMGMDVFNRTFGYIMNTPAGKATLQDDSVILLINDIDDRTPVLNTRENATGQYLKSLGYDVQFLSRFRARYIFYHNVNMVVMCSYNGNYYMGSAYFDGLVDQGVSVLLLYNSGQNIGGSWSSSTHANFLDLYVENNGTLLVNYTQGTSHTVQSGQAAYILYANYPSGWSHIARNTHSTNYKTIFTKENITSGGRAVMYLYDPLYYTPTGRDVFNDSVAWTDGNGSCRIPDLNLTTVSAAGSGYMGEIVVNATIYNDGDTLPYTAYFYVTFYADGEIIGMDRLPVPVSGESVNTSLVWSNINGSYTFTATADPGDAIHESDETNNQASVVLNIGKPDLTVTDIWWDTPPLGGTEMDVNVTLMNNGADCAAPFLVALFVDGRIFGTRVVPSLDSGVYTNVSFSWTARAENHTFRTIVDWTDDIFETSEINNERSELIYIGSVDLEVTGVSYTATMVDGEEVTFNITVNNTGDVATGRDFYLGFLVNGAYQYSVRVGTLDADSSAVVNITWRLTSELVLTFVADYMEEIPEDDETNNKYDLNIGAIERPDLGIKSVTYDARQYRNLEGVTFTLEVENTGNRTMHGIHVALLVDGSFHSAVIIEGMNSSSAETVDILWRPTTGSYNVSFIVDYYDIISELTEANNTWIDIPFYIEGPDLSITDLTWWPATIYDGDNIQLNATVRNEGDGDTIDPFIVEFYLNNASIGAQSVNYLEAGQTTTVGITWRAAPGTWSFLAIADVGKGIAEHNETNNNRTEALPTVEWSDLVVTDLSFVYIYDNAPTGQVSDGDYLLLNATIRNDGASVHRDFNVRFYRDGSLMTRYIGGTLTDFFTINGLEAGKETYIEFRYIFIEGEYNISAMVDSDFVVQESNETNNEWIRGFDVSAWAHGA
ncbi:MAG: hypothetical protein KAU14_05030, partial [Thermoplasmata archaeon]|nr:hypothetical protein [Thermoplasmata archaeon]